MAVMLRVGTLSGMLQRPEPQSGSGCVPARSVGTMRLDFGMLFPTISLVTRCKGTELPTQGTQIQQSSIRCEYPHWLKHTFDAEEM